MELDAEVDRDGDISSMEMTGMNRGRITQQANAVYIGHLNSGGAGVLDWLATGQTAAHVFPAHPRLEEEDLIAVYNFAAQCVRSNCSVQDAFRIIRQDIHNKLETL